MSQTVREIATKYSNPAVVAWSGRHAPTVKEVQALAAHVLASPEPLGDERIGQHFKRLRAVYGNWYPESESVCAIESEIRRLQAELKGAENINSHHVADLDDRDALIADLRAQLQAAQQERDQFSADELRTAKTLMAVRGELREAKQLADKRGREPDTECPVCHGFLQPFVKCWTCKRIGPAGITLTTPEAQR